MTAWRHTLAVAQRRAAARAALSAGASTLPFTAGAALVWAATAAALEQDVRWQIVGTVVALTTLAGAAVGFARRPSSLAVAAALDAQARNHDAIATALQLSAKPSPTLLEARAIADADQAADSADPAATFPWRLKRPMLSAALAAAVLIGAAFIPARWTVKAAQLAGLNAGNPPRAEVQKALEDAAAAEQLIKAVQQPSLASTPPSPDAASARTDPLAELKEQLQQGDLSPKEATQRAATAVERAADQLDQRAAEVQQAHDLLRDRLAQAQKDPAAPPGDAAQSELTRALRDGDIEKAAAEAERLAGGPQGADKLPQSERNKLAEELKKLAEDLKRTPQPQPEPQAQPKPDAATPDAHAKPDTQDQARDLADKINSAAEELAAPTAQPRQTNPTARPDKPSDKQTGKPDASEPPDPQRSDPSQQDRQPRPDEQQGKDKQGSQTKPGDRSSTPQAKPDLTKQESGSKNQQPTPSDKPQSDPSKQPDPQASPDKQQKTEQGTQSPDGKPRSDASKPSPEGQRATEQGNPSPDGQAQQPTSKQQPDGQKNPSEPSPDDNRRSESANSKRHEKPASDQSPPDAQGQAKPDAAKPSPDAQPKPGDQQQSPEIPKGGIEQLRDQLKKLADQPRNAKQDRQDAQKLREQAQKMWDNATPEQRKQMQELARELTKERNNPRAKQDDHQPRADRSPHGSSGGDKPDEQKDRTSAGGGDTDPGAGRGPDDASVSGNPRDPRAATPPTSTRDIDARSKGDTQAPSRVIAEWLTNKPAPRTGDAHPSAPADVTQAVRQAQQNAEQAVQERAVPPRLTPLIRRFFDRLPGALGTQPAQPAPAAPSSTPAIPAP